MRIFLLLVGVTALLSSCTFGKSETAPVAAPISPAALVGVSYAQDLAKASSKIKDTPEFENCMKPSVNMCLSQVGNELARTQKSPAICDELQDVSAKDSCKFGVVMTQASESKDINACDALSVTYKHECRLALLRQKATESKSLKDCDTLASEFPVTDSGSMIPDMKVMQIDQCKMNILQQDQNPNVENCAVLSDKNMQSMCESMIKNRPTAPSAPQTPSLSGATSSGSENAQ